jgi:hypothetical protein
MVSVPFVNYGGPICANEMAAQLLLNEAERLRQSVGATHVELRHLGRNLPGMPTKQHKVTMILELAADAYSQWHVFNAKLRNQIRKAEKCGLPPTPLNLELLDDFYAAFARNMRDLGTPLLPQTFF